MWNNVLHYQKQAFNASLTTTIETIILPMNLAETKSSHFSFSNSRSHGRWFRQQAPQRLHVMWLSPWLSQLCLIAIWIYWEIKSRVCTFEKNFNKHKGNMKAWSVPRNYPEEVADTDINNIIFNFNSVHAKLAMNRQKLFFW